MADTTFIIFLGAVETVSNISSERQKTFHDKIEAFHKAYVYQAWLYPIHSEFIRYWTMNDHIEESDINTQHTYTSET
ncbi:MAG: hypothetical protein ABSD41_13415 [Candidatus Bathyarchaeia archaeon]|jgi:hypothetical protein